MKVAINIDKEEGVIVHVITNKKTNNRFMACTFNVLYDSAFEAGDSFSIILARTVVFSYMYVWKLTGNFTVSSPSQILPIYLYWKITRHC